MCMLSYEPLRKVGNLGATRQNWSISAIPKIHILFNNLEMFRSPNTIWIP